jgi:hypothetical protein
MSSPALARGQPAPDVVQPRSVETSWAASASWLLPWSGQDRESHASERAADRGLLPVAAPSMQATTTTILRGLLADDIAWHVPGRRAIADDWRGYDRVLGYVAHAS